MEVIGAYRDAGLPPVAFAAAVPNNWEKQLQDLLNELLEDDAAAVRRSTVLHCMAIRGLHRVLGAPRGRGALAACAWMIMACGNPYGNGMRVCAESAVHAVTSRWLDGGVWLGTFAVL